MLQKGKLLTQKDITISAMNAIEFHIHPKKYLSLAIPMAQVSSHGISLVDQDLTKFGEILGR